jgi:hypothetical protein
MIKFLFAIAIFIMASFVVVLTFIATKQDKDQITVRYDCRALMGNWHPDFPAEVVAECKKRIKQ